MTEEAEREARIASRRACLENWPEAVNGAYDPHCCRFPKSCSIDDPEPEPSREEVLAKVRSHLVYASSPTMGLPPMTDAIEFARDGATEKNARMALALCIENARSALRLLESLPAEEPPARPESIRPPYLGPEHDLVMSAMMRVTASDGDRYIRLGFMADGSVRWVDAP